MSTPHVPPLHGDVWRQVRSFNGQALSTPIDIVFNGKTRAHLLSGRPVCLSYGGSAFYMERFTDGTLEFVCLGKDERPPIPPEKGDVWRERDGSEITFTGRHYMGDAVRYPDSYEFQGPDGSVDAYGIAAFSVLTFVRRGYVEPSPPPKKRPHSCTRCGHEALVLFQWVECANRKCPNYKA